MSERTPTKKLPFVSVLLAVRNEEEVISKCLDTLINQDFPINCYEVLVGDDDSTDKTATILQKYAIESSVVKLIPIHQHQHNLKGKANALAQLAKVAKGEVYLFTDADMKLPINWISRMLALVNDNTGVVNGFTIPQSVDTLGAFQALDWLMTQKQLSFLETKDIAVTAMGNNMLVTRTAYQDVGGYEKLEFSITEDFQLFSSIVSKGWGFTNAYNLASPAFTLPEPTLNSLISQRLRWMQGAFKLPLALLLPLIINALTFPALFILWFVVPMVSIAIYFVRWLVIVLLSLNVISETKQKNLLKWVWLYDFYNLLLSTGLLFIYPFIKKIMWKDRRYSSKMNEK